MTTEVEMESNTDLKLKETNQESIVYEETKPGEYILSALQAMMLNKKLPPGYKLELEETYLKSVEENKKLANDDTSNITGKRKKNQNPVYNFSEDGRSKTKGNSKKKKNMDLSLSEGSSTNNQNLKRSAREKKPNYKDDLGYVESKAKCKDPKLIELSKKCERVLAKLKKSPYYDLYLNTNSNEIVGLLEIERRVKNFMYTKLQNFSFEIRKLWKHYFLISSSSNIEFYQKTIEIAKYFEDVFEAEENPNENANYEYLNKKIQKLESQFNNTEKYKQTGGGVNTPTTQKPPSRQQVPIHEKPMTIVEKNLLGNSIMQLSHEQMKGILNILSDQYTMDKNSKFFEFDIDKLSTRKLRELEKYVKKCSKAKGGAASKTGKDSSKVRSD